MAYYMDNKNLPKKKKIIGSLTLTEKPSKTLYSASYPLILL